MIARCFSVYAVNLARELTANCKWEDEQMFDYLVDEEMMRKKVQSFWSWTSGLRVGDIVDVSCAR